MEIKLGESIRRLRKESRFTQEQLAEALGVSVRAVHKWESGKATPELEMLVDIAEFFETSVDALTPLTSLTRPMFVSIRSLQKSECCRVMNLAQKNGREKPNGRH